MSIYVYTGTVGTGKTLHAAQNIREDVNGIRPHPVIANFKINAEMLKRPELVTYCPNEELTVDFLRDFALDYWNGHDYKEDMIHLYVDEAQLLYNSRRWTARDRMENLEFYSQSRKAGYRIVFLAQSARMVDNQFRMLMEYEVNHRRVTSMGLPGLILGALCMRRLFLRVEYQYATHERIGSTLYFARKRDMRIYDTNATFELGKSS